MAKARKLLVQPAGFIDKAARQRVERHNTHAGFIADQPDMTRQVWQYLQQGRTLAVEGGGIGQQQIGHPQCQTVDNDSAIAGAVACQCICQL